MKTEFTTFLNESNEKGYTPKYKDQIVVACIKDDYYWSFRKASKFHRRGLRYTDEMENFFQEIKAEPIEYTDELSYVMFKTFPGKEDEVIDKLQKSKYVEFAFRYDNRKEESDDILELSKEMEDFAEEYIEHSDNEIKETIDVFINRLTKLRNSL